MSSAKLFAGSEGLATSTSGTRTTVVISARSRRGSKGMLDIENGAIATAEKLFIASV